MKRVLAFLLNNERVNIIVQTPKEKDYFETMSCKVRVDFVPYCSDSFPSATNSKEGEYIFSGGYTNRDYKLVACVARMFVNEKFVVVASHLNNDTDDMPANVTVHKDIPSQEFYDLLAGARIVIVPLREDVGSSGQMLCLATMRYRKPIIYTDVSSINYYFSSPGAGVPYKIGDAHSLADALRLCLENPEVCEDCGNNAYEESRKFTVKECFREVAQMMGYEE